jgi:hypothetical protein
MIIKNISRMPTAKDAGTENMAVDSKHVVSIDFIYESSSSQQRKKVSILPWL